MLSSKIAKPLSFFLTTVLIDSLESFVRYESHHPRRVPEKPVTRGQLFQGGRDYGYSYKQFQP